MASSAPPATCARCACKLSRYRDAWEQHCLTCRKVLVAEGALIVPTFEPADTAAERARKAATTRPLRCKTCDKPLILGGKPSKTSLCRACLNESIAALVLHCHKCAKPLAGPIRPNASGLCRACLNAHHAANKPRCGACDALIGRSTLYRAQRANRMPRCRACSVGHRYKDAA